ncbi:MAG: hypothetical protein H6834_17330, partial [Planctomycetes bacterium]|nr:hypothetical protein [Planctomycetota bacterium]
MSKTLTALAILLAVAHTPAQTPSVSARIALTANDPTALAAQLEARGFDEESIELDVPNRELRVIATPGEFDELVRLGHAPRILELGRPLHAIQSALDGPPGYPDLAAVEAQLRGFESSHPTLAQLVDVASVYGPGATYEGRPIWALKISDNVAQDEDEPEVLVVACHHCRETVTPLIALTAIDQLLNGYASNPAIRSLVDEHEIWIAPVWNPDGYNHVFTVDNFWRKNRRPFGGGTGVDLNRNYPMGWSSGCAGSTSPSSETYKGPSVASEAETQTMLGFARARRFAKVMDYHSSGREVLYGYRCTSSPLASYYQSEATRLSVAAGYGGAIRVPSAEGEHFQWQLQEFGNFAFLTETHTSFQPAIASAQAEALQLWNQVLAVLQTKIPLQGRVTDGQTGEPLTARITSPSFNYVAGETRETAPDGSYWYWGPNGTYTFTFQALTGGFLPETRALSLMSNGNAQDIGVSPIVTTSSGISRLGQTTTLSLFAPGDANAYYVSIPCVNLTPIVLGHNVVIQGIPDVLTEYAYAGGDFQGLYGNLNFLGGASVTWNIPNIPEAAGMLITFNYVTFDPTLTTIRHGS